SSCVSARRVSVRAESARRVLTTDAGSASGRLSMEGRIAGLARAAYNRLTEIGRVFTGIVEGQGHVESIAPWGNAYRFVVDLGELAAGVKQGDSIALDGTCLTAVSVAPPRVQFDVIQETVERTAFASVRPGDRVNVERSMPAQGRFHGHFVMGHVDGTGRIAEKKLEPRQVRIKIEAPRDVVDQMIV